MGLDERIRSLARLEAAAAATDRSADMAGLQQQITDLHEHLHMAATTISRLEARVDALEKTGAAHPAPEPEQPRPTPRRTSRKDSGG